MRLLQGLAKLLLAACWHYRYGGLAACIGNSTTKLHFSVCGVEVSEGERINWLFYSPSGGQVAMASSIGGNLTTSSSYRDRLGLVSNTGPERASLYLRHLTPEDAGRYGSQIVVGTEVLCMDHITLSFYKSAQPNPLKIIHMVKPWSGQSARCTCCGLTTHGTSTELYLALEGQNTPLVTTRNSCLTYTFKPGDPHGNYQCYLRGPGEQCTSVFSDGNCPWRTRVACHAGLFMVLLLGISVSLHLVSIAVILVKGYRHQDLMFPEGSVVVFALVVATVAVTFRVCGRLRHNSFLLATTVILVVLGLVSVSSAVCIIFFQKKKACIRMTSGPASSLLFLPPKTEAGRSKMTPVEIESQMSADTDMRTSADTGRRSMGGRVRKPRGVELEKETSEAPVRTLSEWDDGTPGDDTQSVRSAPSQPDLDTGESTEGLDTDRDETEAEDPGQPPHRLPPIKKEKKKKKKKKKKSGKKK